MARCVFASEGWREERRTMSAEPTDPRRDLFLRAIAAQPSRTRASGKRRARVLLGISIAAALGFFAAAGGHEHASGRPLWLSLLLTGGWALASAILTVIVTARR